MTKVTEIIDGLMTKREDADLLPNILGRHFLKIANGEMPVVLFGAGSAGFLLCKALEYHDVHITAFCDNNSNSVGTVLAGHPVIPVADLLTMKDKCLVVISTSQEYTGEIREQLYRLGFPLDLVHIPPAEPVLYYTNLVYQERWSQEALQSHAPQLQEVYNLLADDKSRNIFVERIALLSGAFNFASFNDFISRNADLLDEPGVNLFSTPRYDENYFYFNSDFCPIGENEVFANVGALIGDCALEFATACQNRDLTYREIINFEPDPYNFNRLQENTAHLPRMRHMPFGLWSHQDRLRFDNPDSYKVGTPGSLNANGHMEVEVASLDELLPEAEISYIKMDVEGAEMKALMGAITTIRRNKPKLAICVYHKRDDMFKIPLLINNFCDGYEFYLRHYCTTFSETVLFAVPRGVGQ